MKTTKDFYNTTALDWAAKWYSDESMLPCLRDFVGRFSSTPRILDLCCGTGHESRRMKQLGADVTGLDFSERCIEIAREKNPDIKFYVDDMLNDYSYLGQFDGIAVIAGLVHLPNAKLPQAFRFMSKVLDAGGLLLLVVRDGTGKLEQQSFRTIDGDEYDRDFYAHTLDELKAYSADLFLFAEEILPDGDDIWSQYLFIRSNML